MSIRFQVWLKFRRFRNWVADILSAPFMWNTARILAKRQHQLALQQLHIDASTKVLETLGTALITIVDRQSKAQEAQSDVLKTWLEGFKVTTPPTTTAVSDKDEYDLEMAQMMEKDGVDAGNPASVMKWLERESRMATLD